MTGMKPIFFFCMLLGTFLAPTHGQNHNPAALKTAVDSISALGDATLALAFVDLNSSITFFHNADLRMHAASTMKVPVMIEVFRQADQGRFKLSDSVPVHNQFISILDQSPFSLSAEEEAKDFTFGQIGKKMTIFDLVYEMITVSSNLATNILIERVEAENVNQTLRALGADSIRVLRGVSDLKAYDAGLNNTTTARDLMILLQAIATGKAGTPLSCQKMLAIMLDTADRSRIPAALPTNVRVAHKTGSITGIEHDAGIIFLPDGRSYVLVLLAQNFSNAATTVTQLAQLSRAVYDWYLNPKNRNHHDIK